jgi:hypothetical protein
MQRERAGKGEKEDVDNHISKKKTAEQIRGVLHQLNNEFIEMMFGGLELVDLPAGKIEEGGLRGREKGGAAEQQKHQQQMS